MTIRICMWSGPRNLSTAMMRSFESRPDCAVIDEPFFAPYLDATGVDHPGREETLASHEIDPGIAAKLCENPPNGEALYFQKHMPHHMLDKFPLTWMQGARHFFLIRHPARVIVSYAKGRPRFTLEDLGYPQLSKFYEMIGDNAPVLDCDDILRDPDGHIKALCTALDIAFNPAMLNWAQGPRSTDGAWAPYWYKSVENSTGFGRPPSSMPEIPSQYQSIYDQAMPHYERMFVRRLCA